MNVPDQRRKLQPYKASFSRWLGSVRSYHLSCRGKADDFLREHFAALVELTAGNTNILILCRLCCENHLHRFQMDTVDLAQCGQETNNDRCRRGQAANRQTSLDDARQTNFQAVLFTQHLCCATQMVCPIALLFFRHRTNKN